MPSLTTSQELEAARAEALRPYAMRIQSRARGNIARPVRRELAARRQALWEAHAAKELDGLKAALDDAAGERSVQMPAPGHYAAGAFVLAERPWRPLPLHLPPEESRHVQHRCGN